MTSRKPCAILQILPIFRLYKDIILTTFKDLGLSEQILEALTQLGFETPTQVQEATIPEALTGRDLIVSAETGSGKTAAYALPILEAMKDTEAVKKTFDKDAFEAIGKSMRKMPRWQKMKCFKFEPIHTQALVIAPTRELAQQVKEQFLLLNPNRALHVVALYGGSDYEKQMRALKRGAHVIVATPGRLIDYLNKGLAKLDQVKTVVLDEADRLLDLGFSIQINEVLPFLPPSENRQTLVFSATIDKQVAELANSYQKNPQIIKIQGKRIEPKTITQSIHYLEEYEKESKLMELLIAQEGAGASLVFTQTKIKASELTQRLRASNIKAEEIHGDVRQKQREKTLQRFKTGEIRTLIATDVAARGLDIKDLNLVVNYDLPLCAPDYVHRIGRTGRAGRSGEAHSFVTRRELDLLDEIETLVGRQLGDGRKGRQRHGGAKGADRRRGGARPQSQRATGGRDSQFGREKIAGSSSEKSFGKSFGKSFAKAGVKGRGPHSEARGEARGESRPESRGESRGARGGYKGGFQSGTKQSMGKSKFKPARGR